MYRELNLESLKDVVAVELYRTGGTISMQISDGSYLNLAPGGSDDNKAIGFDVNSFDFIVRIIEQVTRYKFCVIRNEANVRIYGRTEKRV